MLPRGSVAPVSIIPVPRVAVIVVAAGSGSRLAAGIPKAFVGLDDHTILRHALRGIFEAPPMQVIVVAPAGREGDALTDAEEAAADRRDLVSVVTGGPSRQASVAAGLAVLWGDVEYVLVHDAARALTPPDVFTRVIGALEAGAAGVVPVMPVVDTIRQMEGDTIVGVVDRSSLTAAQTPQGFPRRILETAYAAADQEYTDDAAVVAAAGHATTTVAGDAIAFKITTRADLDRLEGRYPMINVKLDKAGGLTEALALVQEARARGFQVMIGCMVGSSLAMAPAFLLTPLADYVDLDGPLLIARDFEPGLRDFHFFTFFLVKNMRRPFY